MKLTHEQERLVEENMGLVGSVIARHAGGGRSCGCFDRDDLMQIGAIGLMKAAASYQESKGKFSTYAYVVIRNEISDALVQATRWQQESPSELAVEMADKETEAFAPDVVQDAMLKAKQSMPAATARGVDALILLSQGYSYKEIGERLGASDRAVANWISRARAWLKKDARFMEAAKDAGAA